jgi:hypothetical protein
MPLSPKHASRLAREICGLAPIVPVPVIHDARHARPLAEASGGVASRLRIERVRQSDVRNRPSPKCSAR